MNLCTCMEISIPSCPPSNRFDKSLLACISNFQQGYPVTIILWILAIVLQKMGSSEFLPLWRNFFLILCGLPVWSLMTWFRWFCHCCWCKHKASFRGHWWTKLIFYLWIKNSSFQSHIDLFWRHVPPSSIWISFRIRSQEDLHSWPSA